MRAEGDDMASGLRQVLQHLRPGTGLTDGQLLARFVTARDEASFTALVRRHGPMVLGVCRRVLHDFHDAEDAFQATFLILARKAGSVVKRESLGCWLYQVAYHTALEASETNARRRAREKSMQEIPHPGMAPAEVQDWRPLLDRELHLLPEKYRAAIVLCDLEGRTRKEAARLLKVPEGTLSSRLATGRQMLAKRLMRCGVSLSGGALAVALSHGTGSAALPAALVMSTAKAAALVAVGQMTAVSTPAVLLMKEVMKTMLLKKLRLVVGAVMVTVALGAVGFGYQAGGNSGAAQAAPPDKPLSELEALRKENELLKLNLQVVLEKVRAQEGELQAARQELAAKDARLKGQESQLSLNALQRLSSQNQPLNAHLVPYPNAINTNAYSVPLLHTANNNAYLVPFLDAGTVAQKDGVGDATREAECAIKALREAKDKEAQRRAAEALEKAMKKLREQLK
jgi:RNA polymerase sigma factor (sigma-70 family)